MDLTPRQSEVKEAFIRTRGTWGPVWEHVLRFDPEFLETYLNYSTVPLRRRALDAKTQELVFIAVNAAATHMYEPGVRSHIAAALAADATPAEIMEVLELTSTLGVHTLNVGVPALVEVLEEEGLRAGVAEADQYRKGLREKFTENRGYWRAFWDDILELDPEIFAAYIDFSSVPWTSGTLEPKVKEFIYIAFDFAATHLYALGGKEHMRNALRLGATTAEILEVLEIASVIGIHATLMGAPILAEVLERAEVNA